MEARDLSAVLAVDTRSLVGQSAFVNAMELLSERWRQNWPGCRPVAHTLRSDASDRWVRFHGLPGAKRYPANEDEISEVLYRHNCVIADLVALDPDCSAELTWVHVVTCSWSNSEVPTQRDTAVSRIMPDAEHWTSVSKGEPGFDSWVHLWVAPHMWKHASLDPLLELVADDMTDGVIVMEQDCAWLYHPYDGGADVLAPSAAVKDVLATRRRSWLSHRPDGL